MSLKLPTVSTYWLTTAILRFTWPPSNLHPQVFRSVHGSPFQPEQSWAKQLRDDPWLFMFLTTLNPKTWPYTVIFLKVSPPLVRLDKSFMAKHGNDLAWRSKVLQHFLRWNGSIIWSNDREVVRIIWNKHPFLSPTLYQLEMLILLNAGVNDPEKIWKIWVKWGHLPHFGKSKRGSFFNHSRKMVIRFCWSWQVKLIPLHVYGWYVYTISHEFICYILLHYLRKFRLRNFRYTNEIASSSNRCRQVISSSNRCRHVTAQSSHSSVKSQLSQVTASQVTAQSRHSSVKSQLSHVTAQSSHSSVKSQLSNSSVTSQLSQVTAQSSHSSVKS